MNDSLTTTEDLGVIDPNKDYLEDLVGDGKKFKDPAALARGKVEADFMIKNVIREKNELYDDYKKLKEQYEAGLKLQEVLDRLSSQESGRPLTPEPDDDKQTANIKPEDIENIVSTKIQKMEEQKKQNENFNIVKAKLQERYGTNYQNVVAQQVQALGLSDEDVTSLAKKSPTAFFKTLGLDQEERKDSFQTPPRSDRRSDNFSPSVNKRTWSYYEKMRKTDPTQYHNPKTSVQMLEDIKQYGENVFYDA